MKINLALILSIIVAVGIVSLTFTVIQTTTERQKLNRELELKTIRNSEEFYSNHLKELTSADSASIKKISEQSISRYGFLGIAIYFNADSVVLLDSSVRDFIPQSQII
jgi:cell division protein FtsL